MKRHSADRERLAAIVEWKSIDASGCLYGFYRERDSVWRADITVPGRGHPCQPGPDCVVFVEGERIGVEPSLDNAKALALAYFEAGRHHPQFRRA